MLVVVKVFVSAVLISFASWLAGRAPGLAGFIASLPLTTLIVLPFARIEHADPAASVTFARSIFLAVPLSLLFFVPFLLAERLGLGFWQAYATGCGLLLPAYWIHRAISGS